MLGASSTAATRSRRASTLHLAGIDIVDAIGAVFIRKFLSHSQIY
jgi:hypothetical protein